MRRRADGEGMEERREEGGEVERRKGTYTSDDLVPYPTQRDRTHADYEVVELVGSSSYQRG